jgi:aspartyl-tRNA(Asn)/glutamyl-tRNA(Gln) amidotransferase subunit B
MRTKEDAADYRYFLLTRTCRRWLAATGLKKTRSEMSELPRVMAARFVADYGLSEYDADQLTRASVTKHLKMQRNTLAIRS